jgi:hypothetical protein
MKIGYDEGSEEPIAEGKEDDWCRYRENYGGEGEKVLRGCDGHQRWYVSQFVGLLGI